MDISFDEKDEEELEVEENEEKEEKNVDKIQKNQDYKVIKQLGSGSFGSVLLIDMNNKIYTLKIIKDIDKKDISQYKDEANILSNFNSRYIIRYYNSYIKNNNYYILMEYAGDSNLKNFIRSYKDKGELIDEKIIENIIIQICLGLKEIHSKKIIQ